MGSRVVSGLVLAGCLIACGGTGVREVRSVDGEKVYESKCKGSGGAECVANARAKCSEGYALLDSESHAGGLLADIEPGPVTWYTMTFRCSGFGGSEQPDFAFRGRTYEPGNPVPAEAPVSQRQSAPASQACSSDYECGYGNVCVKPELSFTGTCARAVNENGVPTFSPPRSDSIGPGKGDCSFDTQCPVGFRCVKDGSALRGNCMK